MRGSTFGLPEAPLLLVANPTSGRGRSERWLRRAESRLSQEGVPFRSVLTKAAGDATRAVADRGAARGVWTIGGDGTINEVLQELTGTSVPLSILPAGTGNIVARELGIPRRFPEAYRLACHGIPRALDVGQVNDQRQFLFMASAGLDASIVSRVASQRQGPIRKSDYLRAVFAVRHQVESRFQVTVDGKPLGGACWVGVFNVSRYGPGIRICPPARPDDGQLHLILIRDPLIPRFVRTAWRAFRGRLADFQDGESLTCRSVTLEDVGDAQVDGDPLGAKDLRIELLTDKLLCRAPGRAAP